MKRRPPQDSEGKVIAPPESIELHPLKKELIRETREYELITPLFGGGTETQKADPVSVIRVPSIRGQLRFWWRATRGARFNSTADMKKVEDLIWGSTEHPSAVIIDLQVNDGTIQETAYWMELNRHKGKLEVKNSAMIAPYAAFPLQPDKNEQKEAEWKSEPVVLNVNFTLSLRFPSEINGKENITEIKDVENELRCALWAWETFGGIGGRTRRGFGSLNLIKVNNKPAKAWPADIQKLRTKLLSELTTYASRGVNHPGVPQINPDVSFVLTRIFDNKKPRENAVTAWQFLIEQLQNFRQARYGGKFGKSKWPEANEIRERAGLPLRIAEETDDREFVHKFPRAVFGLPIVFHLHDDGKPEIHLIGNRLEDETSDKYIERLSSPLILRPLACEGGKAVGLALILQTEQTPPRGLYLKGKARNDPQPDAKLEDREALLIEPLIEQEQPRKAQTDVLHAFLNRLK